MHTIIINERRGYKYEVGQVEVCERIWRKKEMELLSQFEEKFKKMLKKFYMVPALLT